MTLTSTFTPEHDLYNKINGLPIDSVFFDSLPETETRAWYDMLREYLRVHAEMSAIRFKIMDENDPVVRDLNWANVGFDWSWKGCGFGQLSFSMNKETGKLTCMNECMGRDSVRKLLIAMANKIADDVELLE